MRRIFWGCLTVAVLGIATLVSKGQSVRAALAPPSFVEFESGPVRPVAKSPDGNRLFAVNTPNGTLEIFSLTSGIPRFEARVPVGLEPVAVAARSNTEVGVTNLLSDSVSVVTLTGTPHVIRTLLVGDEPRDIVFAGTPQRAFITTAHRGQRRMDPALAQVPGRLFTDTPQALAVSPDGNTVYVAGFKPGNRTTTIAQERI